MKYLQGFKVKANGVNIEIQSLEENKKAYLVWNYAVGLGLTANIKEFFKFFDRDITNYSTDKGGKHIYFFVEPIDMKLSDMLEIVNTRINAY